MYYYYYTRLIRIVKFGCLHVYNKRSRKRNNISSVCFLYKPSIFQDHRDQLFYSDLKFNGMRQSICGPTFFRYSALQFHWGINNTLNVDFNNYLCCFHNESFCDMIIVLTNVLMKKEDTGTYLFSHTTTKHFLSVFLTSCQIFAEPEKFQCCYGANYLYSHQCFHQILK